MKYIDAIRMLKLDYLTICFILSSFCNTYELREGKCHPKCGGYVNNLKFSAVIF